MPAKKDTCHILINPTSGFTCQTSGRRRWVLFWEDVPNLDEANQTNGHCHTVI